MDNILFIVLAFVVPVLLVKLLTRPPVDPRHLPLRNEKEPSSSTLGQQEATLVIKEVIKISQTIRYLGDKAFLRQFGLNPSSAAEVSYLLGPKSLEDLPADAAQCLRDSYTEGTCRGPGVPGLLYRNEAVQDGQAIYFVLDRKDSASFPIFTFVGKAQA